MIPPLTSDTSSHLELGVRLGLLFSKWRSHFEFSKDATANGQNGAYQGIPPDFLFAGCCWLWAAGFCCCVLIGLVIWGFRLKTILVIFKINLRKLFPRQDYFDCFMFSSIVKTNINFFNSHISIVKFFKEILCWFRWYWLKQSKSLNLRTVFIANNFLQKPATPVSIARFIAVALLQ